MLEDSNPVSGKDCEVRSTLASPCLEVAVYSNSHFPTAFALGRGSSYGVQPFALHFQMIRQDPIRIRGTQSTYSNAVATVPAIVVLHLQKVVFEHRCSVAEEFASAAPLVQP